MSKQEQQTKENKILRQSREPESSQSQKKQENSSQLSKRDVQVLQRTVGNQALSRMLGTTIQRKMSVGPVGDKHEQEADRTAANIMRRLKRNEGAEGSLQRVEEEELQTKRDNEDVQRVEEEEELQMKPVQRVEEEDELQMKPVQRVEEEDELQMKANHGKEGGDVDTSTEQQIKSAKGSGQPLEAGVQREMEGAFGADFDGVRVHHDAQADTLNRNVNARAFTTGNDIFFRQGEYAPNSDGGQELLAHELTHTIQQGGSDQAVQRFPSLPKWRRNQSNPEEEAPANNSQLRQPTTDSEIGYGKSASLFTTITNFSGIVKSIRTECDAAGGVGRKLEQVGILGEGFSQDAALAAGTGSKVLNAIELAAGSAENGKEVAMAAKSVDGILNFVASGASAVKNVFTGVYTIVKAYNEKSLERLKTLDFALTPIEFVKNALGTVKSLVSACNTFMVVLGGMKAGSNVLPIVGDAISIVTSLIGTLIETARLIRSGIKVITAYKRIQRLREDRKKSGVKLSFLMAYTDVDSADQDKIFKSSSAGKDGTNKENVLELAKYVKKREGMFNQMEAGEKRDEERKKLDMLQDYLVDSELIEINQKREDRQAVPVLAGSFNIAGNLTNIIGKTTAIVTTAAGSAAAGSGAAVGAGISIGTGVGGAALSGLGTILPLGAKGLRETKKFMRKHDAPLTNQDKTSEEKKGRRVNTVRQLLTQAANLPEYEAGNSTIESSYKRIEHRFVASGVDMEKLYKENSFEGRAKLMLKAVAERD